MTMIRTIYIFSTCWSIRGRPSKVYVSSAYVTTFVSGDACVVLAGMLLVYYYIIIIIIIIIITGLLICPFPLKLQAQCAYRVKCTYHLI